MLRSIHASTLFLLMALVVFASITSPALAKNTWPTGNKVAISLSYDDALDSQLDNALPALNKRGLKASFYVVPLSQAFKNRIEEWKQLARQGHELGNHTLFHACDRSKPGRDWVDPFNALDDKTVNDMVNEVTVANTLLTAVDGQQIHTLTPPCFDQKAKDGNYVTAVKNQFLAIKGLEGDDFSSLIAPSNISAAQIIEFIEKQPKNIKLVNILFHGIGGDHLVTSSSEHAKFLDYLQLNEHKYWVDTYRNIMLAKMTQQNKN
ncbi:polysaccharide deacetylase family protein [Paraglaciecola aquimarina]|uniref:Polysaccharide deacetylase family protein n=1 Tax=Paraglaciecola algarum TaxID=3050085 RepID=A0ABS9DAM6_9ALTE|nr:polysaccharide deacetylase family protein [Paraglaciecola sp. G1-23]MCF2950007.1 polysaccharide deacetylase family protein [Paraglaciecola sp. G1-23]